MFNISPSQLFLSQYLEDMHPCKTGGGVLSVSDTFEPSLNSSTEKLPPPQTARRTRIDRAAEFLGIDVIPNVQTQEAAEDVGSRRVRQIISRQSTDGGSRQRMSNVYISRESMLAPD
ncbi:hypothetical protein CDAR_616011 [Caerostris darwini]|uniref:Uncharacterized protein n=1 Tax=Caerostris darwini TaxID=1538125 RepID=A0AAV4RX12_9ARAC|nr:hypothetical protein CDAR_616011 [Caerostris darwini]